MWWRRWLSSSEWAGRPVWLWIALAGLLAHLAYIGITWAFSPVPRWWAAPEDSPGYISAARSILHGRYETVPGDPRFRYFRSPGYPALLAFVALITGGDPGGWTIVFAHALLAALWCGLNYALARRLGIEPEVAALAGIAVVFYPTALALTPVILTDLPAAVALTVSLWFLVTGLQSSRLRMVIVAGLFAGWAILMRPAAQVVLLVWPVVGWLWPNRGNFGWRGVTVLVLSSAAIPALWMAHVHSEIGLWMMNTHTSHHLYAGTCSGVIVRGVPNLHARLENETRRHEFEEVVPGFRTERERVLWEKAQADSIIRVNLDGVLPYLVRTTALFLLSPTKEYYAQFPPSKAHGSSVLLKLLSLTQLALVVWGMVAFARERRWRVVAVLLVVLGGVVGVSLMAGAMAGIRLLLPAALTYVIAGAKGVLSLYRHVVRLVEARPR